MFFADSVHRRPPESGTTGPAGRFTVTPRRVGRSPVAGKLPRPQDHDPEIRGAPPHTGPRVASRSRLETAGRPREAGAVIRMGSLTGRRPSENRARAEPDSAGHGRPHGTALFPPPPHLGLDGGDADRGEPRRRGPVPGGVVDRARVSAGALAGAARPRHRGDRGGARHRAVHDGRPGAEPPPGGGPAASPARPACRCCSRSCRCSAPTSARPRRRSPARSTCSTPIISSASTR